jgi:hypothetical protein
MHYLRIRENFVNAIKLKTLYMNICSNVGGNQSHHQQE